MGRRSRVGYRGGWSLTVEAPQADVTMLGSPYMIFGGYTRYTLDGLACTHGEARQVMDQGRYGYVTAEPPRGYGRTHDENGEPLVILSGIELTEAEAEAVHDGAHPLAVLLPRLVIRALTPEELEGP